MKFYETFILLFTFLLLNIPVFISLYRYLLKRLSPFARAAIGVLYWAVASAAYELAPFVGVLVLLFMVHGKKDEDLQYRDIDIWSISFADARIVIGAALVFKVLISQVNRLYVDVLEKYWGVKPEAQEIVKEFAVGELDYKLLLFALVVLLAPVVEEYIFRYYLYDKLLLPRMPAAVAAIIASALFTLLHYNISGIPTFFGLGLFCTYMYEKKGFYGAVITHVVSNLVTAVFLL